MGYELTARCDECDSILLETDYVVCQSCNEKLVGKIQLLEERIKQLEEQEYGEQK